MEEITSIFVPKAKAIRVLDSLSYPIFDLAFKIVAYPNSESKKYWSQDLRIYTERLRKMQVGYQGRKNYSAEILWDRIWDDSIVSYGLMTFEYYGPTHGSFDLKEVRRIIEEAIRKIMDQ